MSPLSDVWLSPLDLEEDERVVGRQRAARLADEGGNRDVLGLADLAHVVDHVVRVLRDRVVHARFEHGTAAVVVDAQAAADVEDVDRAAVRAQLGVDPGALLDGVLDALDVGDLGADVEVHQPEGVEHVRRAEHLDRVEQLLRAQPELRASAARFLPLPGAARAEAGPHADDRTDARLLRHVEDQRDLLGLLHDQDDLPAQGHAAQREPHVGLVLVAVADDEGVAFQAVRERHRELGLAARLEPHAEAPARPDQLVEDLALLVDLDREDAAVDAVVVELLDRSLERAEDLVDAGLEDLREPDEGREADLAAPQAAQ